VPPSTRMKIAITTNVYGRRKASLTIHIAKAPANSGDLEFQRPPGHTGVLPVSYRG
jgi:hypothetical protein